MEVFKKKSQALVTYCMMHSLPWKVKRLDVVQVVQIVSGPPNFGIMVTDQHLWVTRHFIHLQQETSQTLF